MSEDTWELQVLHKFKYINIKHDLSCLKTKLYTGRAGWGIAWYINGTLIPELVVERGKTYTFLVEGGDNPNNLANYHPLYITDSISGGQLQNSVEDQAVIVFTVKMNCCNS